VRRGLIVTLAVACIVAATAVSSTTPAERCAAAKLRAAARKTNGKLRCHATGALRGSTADAGCLARVETRYLASWTKIEGRGGCYTTNDADAVEARVDEFVDGLVAALPATSTTTVTTSTCPPTTAFYCAQNGFCPTGGPFPPLLCPSGTTCVTTGTNSCECQGDPIPCGSIPGAGNFCQWGTCPAGLTCKSDPGSTSCPPACACQ